MPPSICRTVGAGLSRLSSSYLDRSSFTVPIRFCSAKPMDNRILSDSFSSLKQVSGNLRASSNENGHSDNTGVRPPFLSVETRNSYGNQRKTARNDRQIRLSQVGSVNIEQSERCNTVFDYEDDFPPLSASRSRSKVGKAERDVKRDYANSCNGVPSISPRNNNLVRGSISVFPSIKRSQVLPAGFGKRQRQIYVEKSINGKKASESAADSKESDFRRPSTKVERLKICRLPLVKNPNAKTDSLDFMEQVEVETSGDMDSASRVLRSGMVLLKSYISLPEQVQIVKTCNQLGEGPGGFYRPGYEGGAKLRLYMMCLGQNWDPQTGYIVLHPVDNCEAPPIPGEFNVLVERSIQDARALIKDCEEGDVTHILPSMSPDICIANFYTNTGRLGLHQDRDESASSRRKGLPVVSFSIGDSALFLFGDERDPDKAEGVILESGDVLLFGGKSRMVFHGVSSVIPDTAPAKLREETGLLPGRLNLTFRQY